MLDAKSWLKIPWHYVFALASGVHWVELCPPFPHYVINKLIAEVPVREERLCSGNTCTGL